jgi:hypothetical protein
MTTVGLPDTFTYTTAESVSRLVARSTCAYGSEGWGFESLRARPAVEVIEGVIRAAAFPAHIRMFRRQKVTSE